MEVDPEVAELLGDLPPTRLPAVLVKEGWGHHTMAQMIQYGQPRPSRPAAPGTEQPVYTEHCAQCGRPITASRGDHWMDHAGDKICDGLLIDGDRVANNHVTVDELDFFRRVGKAVKAETYSPITVGPAVKPKTKPLKVIDCSSTKYSHGCPHQCSQKDGHFGFHCCKTCRHLWR